MLHFFPPSGKVK
jgi:hypothetical protein